MIKVAFVNYDGQIAQWASPGDDQQWPDRTMEGTYFIVHLPIDTDMIKFAEENIWNFSTESWVSRLPRPNPYYFWNVAEWHFDYIKFYADVRNQRDTKLYVCDWTQLPDAPISQELKEQWAVYRQALRDVPENLQGITSINEVPWPTPPA